jgi:hypothetical protein
MKAVSLMEPWAMLVAIEAKKIETRSWPTKYRGPLAIHASARCPRWAWDICMDQPFKDALKSAGLLNACGYPMLPLGAVVATVNLVDCVRISAENSPALVTPEWVFGDYMPGRWMWIFEGVQRLPAPVPAKGALGLWEWDGMMAGVSPSPYPLPLGEG